MISQLRVFLIALEEGSLNRAATRLRMSQSTLTRQIQALEAEIGGALLERTTTGIRATDTGHQLAASIAPVLEDYEHALSEARRLARGERDLIRIGYLGSAAQQFLDPALAALRKELPKVKTVLLDFSPGEQIAALRKGEIDLALAGQEGAMASQEFYTQRLTTMPVIAILPAGHPLADRKEISLSELKGESFISSPEVDMPGRDRWIVQMCRKAGFKPKFGTSADGLSRMLTAVGSEEAIALAPAYLISHPTAGVAKVLISDAEATWDFLVVWQRGKTSAAVKALLRLLAEVAKQGCVDHKR